jgi:hypothetical protein
MADISIKKSDIVYADAQTVDCYLSTADIESQTIKKSLTLREMEELGATIGQGGKQAEYETEIAFSDHRDNTKLVRNKIGTFTGEVYTNKQNAQYLLIKCQFNIVLHNSGGIFGSWFSGDGTKYAVTKNLWIKLDHLTTIAGISQAEQDKIAEAEREKLIKDALKNNPVVPPPAKDNTKTIFGVVVTIVLCGGGYYLWQERKRKNAVRNAAVLGILNGNTPERQKI